MKTINELNDFIRNNPLVIIYITGKDCNLCKSLRPKIEEMAGNLQEVKAAYVYADEMPEVSGTFSVFTIPTIICFVEGKEALRYSRNVTVNELKERLLRYIELMK